MVIEDSKVVSIQYTLKNESGEILSRSPEDKPLTYMQGTNSIIPGLEKELAGREEQEEFSVELQPEEGYGPVHPQLISVLDRKAFQGNTQIITVKAVEGDKVTVDGNHPLAGKTLYFDIKVESVREPTEEELENAPKPE